MDWKASVYSDGSPWFVDPAVPRLGHEFTLGLQMLDNDEVEGVWVRLIRNGSEAQVPMVRRGTRGPLALWQASLVMNQREVNYHFYLSTRAGLWFYNQEGLHDVPPTEERDFKLGVDRQTPAWVRRAVFYQIFPDRFHQGDPALAVRDGEYTFDGHPTVKMAWDQPPRDYHKVFCLDFYGGDLPGIEAKIPYLKDLGVTALYLNPIFHSATSHRYDCLDYFHVDPHLGGDEALARLSAALKVAGIKLMVDVSINHTGTAHRWFNKEGTFFPPTEGAYHNPGSKERDYYFFGPGNHYHPWAGVETLPTLNYTSQALRDILYRAEDSVVKKWLKPPYSIDAWRFDVANDMAKKDEVDLSHEVWREIHAGIRQTRQDAYLLAEHWTDSTSYLQGDQWDSAMNYHGSARPLRRFVGLPDLFLQKFPDLGPQAPLTAPQLSRWITGHLSRLPWQNQACQFNLLGSHDTDRLHNHPDLGWDRYEAAVMMLFTLPGAPNVYYGDEVGLAGRLDSNEGFRYPMEWDQGKWDLRHRNLYRTLSHLKQQAACLHDGGFQILFAQGFVISWARFTPDEVLVLTASMDPGTTTVTLPLAQVGAEARWTWKDGFDRPWQSATGAAWAEDGLRLTLPPGRAWLLRGQRP